MHWSRRRQTTNRGLDGGEDGDGEVAAEVAVGDEAAEEAEHEGGADEIGDGVGGGGIAEVHGARHVRHQVHRDAQRRHPLEQLRAFDHDTEPKSVPRMHGRHEQRMGTAQVMCRVRGSEMEGKLET
jgi:hypothetical protein